MHSSSNARVQGMRRTRPPLAIHEGFGRLPTSSFALIMIWSEAPLPASMFLDEVPCFLKCETRVSRERMHEAEGLKEKRKG
jgi:hypothetical protein